MLKTPSWKAKKKPKYFFLLAQKFTLKQYSLTQLKSLIPGVLSVSQWEVKDSQNDALIANLAWRYVLCPTKKPALQFTAIILCCNKIVVGCGGWDYQCINVALKRDTKSMYRGNDILANDNQEVTRDVQKMIYLSYCFSKDTLLEYPFDLSPFVHSKVIKLLCFWDIFITFKSSAVYLVFLDASLWNINEKLTHTVIEFVWLLHSCLISLLLTLQSNNRN